MQSIQSTVGVTLAILLILAVLVLGILAWRKQRGDAAAQKAQADEAPDKQVQRPVWRPGDGAP